MKEKQSKILKIFKKNNVDFSYIFGSQITKKTDFESDVDLAVYLNENCKDFFKTRLILIEKLQDIFKKNIDLIILNEQKSIFLKFVIIKEGKVIFENNHEKRVDFELKTMQEYYDFQPFLKKYNQAYLERELIKI